jgi:hypothetical protein
MAKIVVIGSLKMDLVAVAPATSATFAESSSRMTEPNLQQCAPEAFPRRSSQQDPTRRAATPLLPSARACA